MSHNQERYNLSSDRSSFNFNWCIEFSGLRKLPKKPLKTIKCQIWKRRSGMCLTMLCKIFARWEAYNICMVINKLSSYIEKIIWENRPGKAAAIDETFRKHERMQNFKRSSKERNGKIDFLGDELSSLLKDNHLLFSYAWTSLTLDGLYSILKLVISGAENVENCTESGSKRGFLNDYEKTAFVRFSFFLSWCLSTCL